MTRDKKNNFWKKKTAGIIVLFCLFFHSVPMAKAMWYDAIAGAMIRNIWTEAFDAIKAQMLSQAKKKAIKELMGLIEEKVGGNSGGGSSVIADYEDFIYGAAKREAEKQINDFFSEIDKGLDEGMREVMRSVEETVMSEINPEIPEATIDKYISSANPSEDILNQSVGGGWSAFLDFHFGEVDHPMNAYQYAKKMALARAQMIQESQKTEAQAGLGFKTSSEGGKVKPGSTLSLVTAAVEQMPMKLITEATNFAEVLAEVASAAVSSLFDQGIEMGSDQMSNQVEKIENNVQGGVGEVQDAIYSGFEGELGDLNSLEE